MPHYPAACRTLEGIVLSSPVSRNCTFTNQEVAAFESTYTSAERAEAELGRCRQDYFTEELCGAFNLKRLAFLYGKLNDIWQKDLVKLYPALAGTFAALPFVEIENSDIKKIFKAANENFLKELRFRLLVYMDIPAEGFSLKRYARIRTECELEQFTTLKSLAKSLTAITGDADNAARGDSLKQESRNPEALEALIAWRKEKSSEQKIAPYMVLQQKTLLQISNNLPESREELLQADGFGKVKWEKYGNELLRLLRPFTER